MKIKIIQLFLIALLLSCSFIACTTSSSDSNNNEDPCASLALLHAQPFTAVTKGEEINLSADFLENAYYHWTGPNGFDSYGENAFVSSSAYYNHRGWYYVNISMEGCEDRGDSVYVDVKFPQGIPSCTLVNNKAIFSGAVVLGNQTFDSNSTWGPAPVGSNYQVNASGTNGDMNLFMSPYWLTHDFEDGIYYTTNDPFPEYGEYDKIFISDVNGSIYWTCEANKPVYISHVGNKLRISFCNINFSGSQGGPSYTTTISAQITQP